MGDTTRSNRPSSARARSPIARQTADTTDRSSAGRGAPSDHRAGLDSSLRAAARPSPRTCALAPRVRTEKVLSPISSGNTSARYGVISGVARTGRYLTVRPVRSSRRANVRRLPRDGSGIMEQDRLRHPRHRDRSRCARDADPGRRFVDAVAERWQRARREYGVDSRSFSSSIRFARCFWLEAPSGDRSPPKPRKSRSMTMSRSSEKR